MRAQHLVAGLVPLMHSEDTDAHMAILQAAAATFQKGKARRIQYTLPPLVFATLRLVGRVRAREGTVRCAPLRVVGDSRTPQHWMAGRRCCVCGRGAVSIS